MQGEYAAFVAAAYGLSAFAVAGLLAWVALDARARRAELAALNEAGVRRRSARGEAS